MSGVLELNPHKPHVPRLPTPNDVHCQAAKPEPASKPTSRRDRPLAVAAAPQTVPIG